MDTAVMGKISLMTERGLAKVKAKEDAEYAAEQRAIQRFKDEWQVLQDKIACAFDEAIRTFVKVKGTNEESPIGGPGDRMYFDVLIDIPGFAPISACARLVDGSWKQSKHLYHGQETRYYYRIPNAEKDFEFGVIYNWRYETNDTAELDEALAFARREGDKYVTLKKEEEELKARKALAVHEPTYEPVDDEGGLVNELVSFVRGIVDERLAQQESA